MTAEEPQRTLDPSLDDLGYAEAVAELEGILEQLDGDEVDVDHLAAQVRRASELIALCRSRLAAARMEVTRVVADLGAVPTTSAADLPLEPTDGDGPEGDGEDGDVDEDGDGLDPAVSS